MTRNLTVLELLQNADAGLLSPADIPPELPRARKVYKNTSDAFVGHVLDKNIKKCNSKCAVCGTRYPLVTHHIFNWNRLKELGIDNIVDAGGLAVRNQFLVTVCPNCHYLIHDKGVHRKGNKNGSREELG